MDNALKKILFVSPHEGLLESFKKFERSKDWEMDPCSDSFSAIQKIKAASYDAIVMDAEISPLDPFKLMDYISHELQKEMTMVIVGNEKEDTETKHTSYLRLCHPIDSNDLDKMVVHMGMAPEKKEEPKLFSLDYLNELSDNNQDFIEESIQLFLDSISVKLTELEKSISDTNYEEARQIAHNVKPTFAMLGNEKGKNICHSICYDVADDEIPKLAKVLKDQTESIISEIEKEFPQLKPYEKENFGH